MRSLSAFRRLLTLLSLILIPTTIPLKGQHRETFHICGDEEEIGSGLPPGEIGLVDRFNRPWRATEQMIKHQSHSSRSPQVDDACSPFRVDFEDVILGNGIGFDDRTEIDHPVLGRTTLGALRRRTVCEVLAYVAGTIVVRGTPDIIVRGSQTDGSGFLAAAGPFFINTVNGYTGGTLFDHITAGVDPTPAPGSYDGMIIVDFGFSYHEDWSTDPGNRLDLYSIMLHEVTHALGFLSLTAPDGSSRIGGGYSLFDKHLYEDRIGNLIDPVTLAFRGTPATILSNAVYYQGERCGDPSPVYSPDPYRQGSSMSHFDPYRSGVRYVMRPATGGGADRRYTTEELNVFCEMGYELQGGVCNSCAPRGVDDFGSTDQGAEICLDVLANDLNPDGGPIFIDPNSVRIRSGGGSFRIEDEKLCYTPSASFYGLAVLVYAPWNGERVGSEARVYINVKRPSSPPFSRREYLRWYFGDNAGISFVNGSPEPLTDGALITHEGCATYSDPFTGDLLFYTDGITVWDRTHTPMPNGTELLGEHSSTQSVVIIPEPCDPCGGTPCGNRYYLATAHTPTTGPDGNPVFGVRYSIVDMRLNEGKGDVVEKNVVVLPYGPEKLVAARHGNGRDYWLLTHEIGTDAFLAFPVTPSGIGDPVVSHVGTVYQFHLDSVYSIRSGIGYLKVSPDGTKVGAANTYVFGGGDYWESNVELFDFDNRTGLLSNARTLLQVQQGQFYGLSFSPDSKLLYAARYEIDDNMFQWNLDAGDGTLQDILASTTTFVLPRYVRIGALQIGPDDRIYFNLVNESLLGVIEEPNVPGTGCNLVLEATHLENRVSRYGLPNNIDSDPVRDSAGSGSEGGIRLVKSLENEHVRYGDTLFYTIRVCNDMPCDAVDVMIEDILPDGVEYIDGFSDYPRHTFPVIASGQCVSVTLRAVAGNRIPPATTVTNCAEIVGLAPDPGQIRYDSNCADFTIFGTDIGIVKMTEADTVRTGEEFDYTITVVNYGPEDGEDVIVEELLPSGLRYKRHRLSDPDADYDPVSGLLSIPRLPIGKSVELILTCEANGSQAGTILNCASLVDGKPGDLDLTNNRSCAPVFVGSPVLTLAKEALTPAPRYGGEVIYRISIGNEGNLDMRNVVIREAIPAGLTWVRHTISDPDADYDPVTGLLTIPSLAVGERVEMELVCLLDEEGDRPTITNCVEGISAEGVDPGTLGAACADITPRWCNQPDVTVRTRIDRDIIAPLDRPFVVPVILEDDISAEPLSQLNLELRFDSRLLQLINGTDAPSLLKGTLLEGWTLRSSSLSGGTYRVELTSPVGTTSINGTGPLLNPQFRMYLGRTDSSELSFSILAPDNRCLLFLSETGLVRLDSLCGLSDRLLEISLLKYGLEPLHPNPAYEAPTISFTLGLDGPTQLTLFDLSGRPVAVLVDRHLTAGTYNLTWDASGIPAGIYICRIVSGDWFQQREFVLLR